MRKYLVFASLAGLLFSCITTNTPLLYVPNPLNMPLPQAPKELQINPRFGFDGYGAQASYAVDSHLVIFANGSFLYDGTYLDRLTTDGGAGYYQKIDNIGRFEILGSAGFGFVNDLPINGYGEFFDPYAEAEFLNIYAKMGRTSIQADIGVGNKNFNMGLGLRLTDIFFSGEYDATYFSGNGKLDSLKVLPLNGNSLMIEPCLLFSAGTRNVKLECTLGLSTNLSGLKINPYYGPLYHPFMASIGVNIALFKREH